MLLRTCASLARPFHTSAAAAARTAAPLLHLPQRHQRQRQTHTNASASHAEPDLHRAILASFPMPVSFAAAYGSGVFAQGSTSTQGKVIDFLIAVDDAEEWHRRNLEANPSHYSGLRFGGPKLITFVQSLAAKLYFNTLVPWRHHTIKYGVISTKDMLEDLQHWHSLYISGRLHKPVRVLTCAPHVAAACSENLHAAVAASLLVLPPRFTERELYTAITGLSYSGDFRMAVGEDPNKIHNIVSGSWAEFSALYEPILKATPLHREQTTSTETEDLFEQDKSPARMEALVASLPRNLRTRLPKDLPVAEQAAAVPKATASIVAQSALLQSVKGVFTAGIVKSAVYSAAKLKKKWLAPAAKK
eukprot:m.151097 g.151097  ORF g.151097 m.151097 type:complete len:360 (-) comp16894_c4_seq18:476-1555(-)